MKIQIEITTETAHAALVESLGWSMGAVAKQIDRGRPENVDHARTKWLALDTILTDITTQRRAQIASL